MFQRSALGEERPGLSQRCQTAEASAFPVLGGGFGRPGWLFSCLRSVRVYLGCVVDTWYVCMYIYIIYIIRYFQLHYFIQLYAFCCCTINRIAVKDYRIYLQLDRCAPPNPMCFLPLCLSDLGRILDHAFLSWYVSFVLPFDYVFLLASFHPFDSESVLGKVIHQST